MNYVEVTVIGRQNCHLCHEAIELIKPILQHFQNVSLKEVSVDENPALTRIYSEKIPVIFINDQEHCFWHIDPERFRKSLVKKGAVVRAESL
tara:strand:+ start:112 stop:387 length:276 start_codon:yes stop_codon:yes gene_type:complete